MVEAFGDSNAGIKNVAGLNAWGRFNPDSAVAIHGKREAQSFRSKVDGLVPLSK